MCPFFPRTFLNLKSKILTSQTELSAQGQPSLCKVFCSLLGSIIHMKVTAVEMCLHGFMYVSMSCPAAQEWRCLCAGMHVHDFMCIKACESVLEWENQDWKGTALGNVYLHNKISTIVFEIVLKPSLGFTSIVQAFCVKVFIVSCKEGGSVNGKLHSPKFF